MRAGSLFSGVGGLDLAVNHFYGAETAWFCESDPRYRTILERHFPGIPIYTDVIVPQQAVLTLALLTGK